MKKLFAALFVFVFSVSVVSASEVFPDIGTRNKTAIEFLHQTGTIQGYPDGRFRPRKPLNRAELLKVVMSGIGITPDASYRDCFPDVQKEWFAPFVCYAKEQEWVGGYTDGTFRPDQLISRAEALKIIFNITGLTEAGIQSFVIVNGEEFDDVRTDEWYSYYVYDARDRGLLEQISGSFIPAKNITRGEFSEIMFRVLVTLIQQEYLYSEKEEYDIDEIAQNFKAQREANTLQNLKPVERTITKLQGFDALIQLYDIEFQKFVEEFESEQYAESLERINTLILIIDNLDDLLKKIEVAEEESPEWIAESREINEQRRVSTEELLATNQELLDSLDSIADLEREKEERIQYLCEKYSDWTRQDCEDIANRLIWVGMSYEMLLELRGEPDHANPSNYGYGTEWQWCWDDYSPSCFYDQDDDGLSDAYNG